MRSRTDGVCNTPLYRPPWGRSRPHLSLREGLEKPPFPLALHRGGSVLAVKGSLRRFAPWTAPGRSERRAAYEGKGGGSGRGVRGRVASPLAHDKGYYHSYCGGERAARNLSALPAALSRSRGALSPAQRRSRASGLTRLSAEAIRGFECRVRLPVPPRYVVSLLFSVSVRARPPLGCLRRLKAAPGGLQAAKRREVSTGVGDPGEFSHVGILRRQWPVLLAPGIPHREIALRHGGLCSEAVEDKGKTVRLSKVAVRHEIAPETSRINGARQSEDQLPPARD